MTQTPVPMDDFHVVGVAAWTTNAKEMSGTGVIGPLWQRVMAEQLIEKIPNRVGSDIIAVYTDYASDANGEYTFILGTRVKSDTFVPEGMIIRRIPAGRYAVFTSQQGPSWKVVPELWQKIWSTPASEMGGERSYNADFEIYDDRARDPQNAVVDVCVGIK